MKTLSEKRGIALLSMLRNKFRARIAHGYEFRAKDCESCEVQGSCCTDAHFVNVRISRLDAAAINKTLKDLPVGLREKVSARNREVMAQSGNSERYACPLFEPGVGCLVHETAKPLPCINHACYERKEDLPPDEILNAAEERINRLNTAVYRKEWNWKPIPEWIK